LYIGTNHKLTNSHNIKFLNIGAIDCLHISFWILDIIICSSGSIFLKSVVKLYYLAQPAKFPSSLTFSGLSSFAVLKTNQWGMQEELEEPEKTDKVSSALQQ
jgi:hypothetical protein